jgi:hypothetical protein
LKRPTRKVHRKNLLQNLTGDRATVVGVDDIGDLLCEWDSGSMLKLISSADQFRKLTKTE